MNYAFSQAKKAYSIDEVPIGAIVVLNNQIIGKGYNQCETLSDPTAHAEMIAITAASNTLEDWRLEEAILFVTKEPCAMCAGAILNSRLKMIVQCNMKNPFKKKKSEKEKVENKAKKPSMEEMRSVPQSRRSALNEPPIPKEDIPMSDNEYKLNHLVETELNVIQKKAKSLHLNSEEGFTEKSDNNYWKVSVNEFMRYINAPVVQWIE